jgi:hypothetical protein
MSLRIRDFVGHWKDVLVLGSVIIGLLVFIAQSNKSSGRQEESLTNIRAKQTEQDKSLNDFKSETLANKEKQDVVNTSVALAMTNITNNNQKTALVLRALLIDHKQLMKIHGLYPQVPDFNYQPGKIDSSEKKAPSSYCKISSSLTMKPFPQ